MTHEEIKDAVIKTLVDILKPHNDAHIRIEAARLLADICDIAGP